MAGLVEMRSECGGLQKALKELCDWTGASDGGSKFGRSVKPQVSCPKSLLRPLKS